MLLGFTGVAKSGKDTVAEHLCKTRGFNRHGFADKLKELAIEANPSIHIESRLWSEARMSETKMLDMHCLGFLEVSGDITSPKNGCVYDLGSIVHALGWDKAKEIDDVRRFLQNLGVGARRVFGEGFWVEQLRKVLTDKYDTYTSGMDGQAFQSNIAISDVRFKNEVDFIHKYGGVVIKVDRGLPPVNGHESEKLDFPVDLTLHNTAGLEDLYVGMDKVMEFLGAK